MAPNAKGTHKNGASRAKKARKSRNRAKAKQHAQKQYQSKSNLEQGNEPRETDQNEVGNRYDFKVKRQTKSKANQRWHQRKLNKAGKIKAGTWKEFKIELSDSDTAVPVPTTKPEYTTLPLSIKTAMYNAGVPFDRSSVIPLLVAVFEMAAISCYATYVTEPDDTDQTALTGAIETCRRGAKWASGLSQAVFADLLLSIRAARRMHLKVTGFDDTDPNSWVRKLGVAVDKFDAAVLHRGWGAIREVLGMEAADDGSDDDSDSGDDDGHFKDISNSFASMDINRADEIEDEGRKKNGHVADAEPKIEEVGEDDEHVSEEGETKRFLSMELY